MLGFLGCGADRRADRFAICPHLRIEIWGTQLCGRVRCGPPAPGQNQLQPKQRRRHQHRRREVPQRLVQPRRRLRRPIACEISCSPLCQILRIALNFRALADKNNPIICFLSIAYNISNNPRFGSPIALQADITPAWGKGHAIST